jgi:hypothetical protein
MALEARKMDSLFQGTFACSTLTILQMTCCMAHFASPPINAIALAASLSLFVHEVGGARAKVGLSALLVDCDDCLQHRKQRLGLVRVD